MEAHKATDVVLAKLERRLRIAYSQKFVGIKKQLAELLGEINGEGLTPLERYTLAMKYKRLEKLQEKLTDTLQEVTLDCVKEVNKSLVDVYKLNYDASVGIANALIGGVVILQPKGVSAEIKETQSPLNKIALENVKGKTELSREIGRQITQGVMQGEDINKLVQRIQKVTEAKLSDITRIARTQTTRVENLAMQDVVNRWEVPKGYEKTKTWRAVLDGHEREAHRAVDGQTIPFDEAFIVDGEELMYPADPNGSAGNIINCRCHIEIGKRKII